MKQAFTLVEVLVVCAIIAALAALTFSTLLQSSESANQTTCASNLRQLWLAVAMYREENEPHSQTGSIAAMGLPPEPRLIQPEVLWLSCPDRHFRMGSIPQNYLWMPGLIGSQAEVTDWIPISEKYEDATVLISDWQHNDDETLRLTQYEKLGFGIELSGSLRRKKAAGPIPRLRWWHPL